MTKQSEVQSEGSNEVARAEMILVPKLMMAPNNAVDYEETVYFTTGMTQNTMSAQQASDLQAKVTAKCSWVVPGSASASAELKSKMAASQNSCTAVNTESREKTTVLRWNHNSARANTDGMYAYQGTLRIITKGGNVVNIGGEVLIVEPQPILET